MSARRSVLLRIDPLFTTPLQYGCRVKFLLLNLNIIHMLYASELNENKMQKYICFTIFSQEDIA